MTSKPCCPPKSAVTRRDVVQGLSLIAGTGLPGAAMAGAVSPELAAETPIPRDKKLDPAWRESLFDRGQPTAYRHWAEQRFIGMPVSGIGTGTVYVGGDGKLWCWDIFNQLHEGVVPADPKAQDNVQIHAGILRERDGANYVYPPEQRGPWNIEQGFAVVVRDSQGETRRNLDRTGFNEVVFRGQAPIAEISYRDAQSPLAIDLEVFTPFIPLDEDRSSLPATTLHYRLSNAGHETITVSFEGWCANPVLRYSGNHLEAGLINRTFATADGAGVIVEGADSPDSHIATMPDFGSMALFLCDQNAQATATSFLSGTDRRHVDRANQIGGSPGVAGIATSLTIKPGETADVRAIVSWYFPNLVVEALKPERVVPGQSPNGQKRWYASKFADAGEVASHVAQNIAPLSALTRAWRDCWYNSTLPNWILERAFIPVNTLQTNTCFRLANGRFWAWEGVGCCAGTCTHVWHYAQSAARLFPALERDLRTRTDFGLALGENGAIRFRGEYNTHEATDGQAGVILRTYREYLTSADDHFLRPIWTKVKRALDYLIAQDARDGPPNGIPAGEQNNTLDAAWFGKIPAMASLYLAALCAGEAMALAMGDTAYARKCGAILGVGRRNILELFDPVKGYFVQEEDPEHSDAIGIGTGCYIDQVIGQWWAFQLGLGRLYDGPHIRRALSALWDYNFCPDMGRLRESIPTPELRGRPYALTGEAGLVMCTWPFGGRRADWEKHWQYGYFNECMTGFEYQVAGHMIWESDEQPDLLEKGLAITRAVHDRYDGARRNPFNEIECSDHYARAMASYGVFLALCGFEYDGPHKHLAFRPRLTHDNRFKAAFTAAHGWGSFEMIAAPDRFEAQVSIAYGHIELASLGLRVPDGFHPGRVETNNGPATLVRNGIDVTIRFARTAKITSGRTLKVTLLRKGR